VKKSGSIVGVVGAWNWTAVRWLDVPLDDREINLPSRLSKHLNGPMRRTERDAVKREGEGGQEGGPSEG
jgi:hypothetical protein